MTVERESTMRTPYLTGAGLLVGALLHPALAFG